MGAGCMIRIFEVGPRDGLQNERKTLPLEQKLNLIEGLLKAGMKDVEVGAFVRPDRIPQMADTDELYRSERFRALQKQFSDAHFWALVPNEKGLDRAIDSGTRSVAVFTGATETFVQKNIGMSIDESLETFRKVVNRALHEGIAVRGYISVCWVCPYEGVVKPQAVVRVAKALLDLGIPDISLGDTIGKAHPSGTDALLSAVFKLAKPEHFGVHFHDTYGMALANIDHAIKMGIEVVDSSVGGLGGCPYAPGAAGNVATEDVYSLLEGYSDLAIQKLEASTLLENSAMAQEYVGHILPSKRLTAWLSHQNKKTQRN
ncbi:MAG: hydroxymethylglutaryl-CoA lyase [Acidobacteria bacterium]|nr:MAG: hydroxymethylglutaryl-CoA lyase [Acidobacteriota bacterium]